MLNNLENEVKLRALIHLSARYLDDRNYQAFIALFLEESEYRVSCKAPELTAPMIWMQLDRNELTERINSESAQEWEIATIEQTRIISVDEINLRKETADVSSSFSLYQTDQEGRSSLYALGRYDDKWKETNGEWRLSVREVRLKTRMLKLLSPLPI